MIHKETISLARLADQSTTKELAKTLAGRAPEGDSETWTEQFAASGAKPGGKPPAAPNE
jgi:hypothetical protein